jgi:hypothetical protein
LGPSRKGSVGKKSGKNRLQELAFLHGGPKVRIRLPPGESPLRTWTADNSGVLGQCRWETEPSAVSCSSAGRRPLRWNRPGRGMFSQEPGRVACPKQATPSGKRRDDSSGNNIGGHRRSSAVLHVRRVLIVGAQGLAMSKRSGKRGPTAMYSWSIRFCLANGRPSMIACASATSLESSRKTAPRPSPREYHSRIFPLR